MPDLVYRVKFEIDKSGLETLSGSGIASGMSGAASATSQFEEVVKALTGAIRDNTAATSNNEKQTQSSTEVKKRKKSATALLTQDIKKESAELKKLTQTIGLNASATDEEVLALTNKRNVVGDLIDAATRHAQSTKMSASASRSLTSAVTSSAGAVKRADAELGKFGRSFNIVATQSENSSQQLNGLIASTKRAVAEVQRYNAITEVRGNLNEEEVAGYRQSLAVLEQLRLEMAKLAGTVDTLDDKEIQRLEASLTRAGRASTQANRYLAGMAGQMTGVNRLGNNTNQIMFAFGDAIQDSAQFTQGFASGMRAVGNNLTFAAEQFTYAYARAGSFGALLKTMGATLMGPVGIVVGFNALITAFTVIPQYFGKAEEKVTDLNEAIKDFIREYSSLRDIGTYDPLDVRSMERQTIVMNQLLNATNQVVEAQNRLAQEQYRLRYINNIAIASLTSTSGALYGLREQALAYFEAIKAGFVGVGGVAGLTQGAQFILSQGVRAAEADLKSLEKQFGLTADEVELLKEEYERLNKEIERSNALMKVDPLMLYSRMMDENVSKAIFDFQSGVTGSSRALMDQELILEQLIDSFRAAYQRGEANARAYLEMLIPMAERVSKALEPLKISEAFSFEFLTSGEIAQDLENFADSVNRPFEEESQRELNRRMTELLKERLASIKDSINAHKELVKESAEEEVDIERMKADAMKSISQSTYQFLASLSQTFASDNKVLAITLLGIEKGLRIAEVVTEAAKNIGIVKMEAAKTFASYMPNVAAATAASASVMAAVPKIKVAAAASIAAIAAQGIGQARSISSGGTSMSGGGGGSRQKSATGIRVETEERTAFGSAFSRPSYMPAGQGASPVINVTNQVLADNESLYILTKQGERSITSKQL